MRSIDIKNLKTKFSNASKKTINGKRISKSQKDEYLIMSAVEKLVDKNLTNYTTTDSLTGEAINLLSTIGVTIDTTLNKDLDLKKEVTDTETITNPNIEDKNLKNLKNKKTDAKDKFPDPDDSFYKLGKQQRQFKQRDNGNQATMLPELAIQKIAAAISEVNLDPSDETKFDEFK
jgi:hypothetical protein